MNDSSRPRIALSAIALAATLILGACSSADNSHEANASMVDGSPQGVKDPAEVPAGSDADDSCEPLESYKPSTSMDSAEISKIRERGRLKVGVDQTTYLMGYRDPRSGEMDGFDIQVAQEIAADLLGSPDKIQYVALSSSERDTALNAGDVDLVVRTMTINCERWDKVEFSGEYYRAGQKVLVPSTASKNVSELADKKVCSAEGSTSLRRIEQDLDANPVSVKDWTDCMILVQQGSVAAMSTDDVILAGMAAQDPNTKVIGEPISEEPYGVAAKKGNVDLIKFVNSTLDRICEDGTWQDIYKSTLQDTLGKTSPPKPEYGRNT